MRELFGLYFHFPFCERKCEYCAFNSYAIGNTNIEPFIDKYLSDLEYYAKELGDKTVTSIYFGGGTPSLIPPNFINAILEHTASLFKLGNPEITLEGNPESLTFNKIKALKSAGINRLSIGVQALNDEDLIFLGRIHNAEKAKQTIEAAKDFFDNVSVDLIFGRPKQKVIDLDEELEKILKFNLPHISFYVLTIEQGTPFYKQKVPKVKDARFLKMYHLIKEKLGKKGLEQYEVSNYAKQGYKGLHNQTYWRGFDYLGIGSGAHSRIKRDGKIYAVQEEKAPYIWVKNSPKFNDSQVISSYERGEELLLLGLRTDEGIFSDIFKLQSDLELKDIISESKLKRFIKQNMLTVSDDGNNIKPTEKGLLFADYLAVNLLKDVYLE